MEQIKLFLQEEKKLSPAVVKRMIREFEQHRDISDELAIWIQKREYQKKDPVKVEGYTANDIYQLAPFLDGLGVFNFLISLREQPEKAKEQIVLGFPRK